MPTCGRPRVPPERVTALMAGYKTNAGASRYSERLIDTGVEAPRGTAAVRPELP